MDFTKKFIKSIKDGDNKTSIIENSKEYSYTDFYNNIKNHYKLINESKIKKGDLVIIMGDYTFNSLSLFFALSLNKNIIIPISSNNKNENQIKIDESNADWIINIDNFEIVKNNNKKSNENHLINELKISNKPGLILFSSGTSGKPKVMLHNLENLFSLFVNKKSKNRCFLLFLMFDHIGGLNTLLNIISIKSKLVIPSNRDPEKICKLIEIHKINILPASPTFLNLIIISKAYEKYDLSSLLMVTYGTEPMPSSLLNTLRDKFKKVRFLQTFGTSETGIIKSSSKSSSSLLMKFDDPNQQYKIEEGELYLKSKTQILGYINQSNDNFSDDGWFKTGDLVEKMNDGYIKIIGRKNEVINIGGEKVNPGEVENFILELDFILDCTVYSKPNPIMGQMMYARVVINTDLMNNEVKKKIRNHCLNRLEKFKVPSKFIIERKLDYSNRFKKIRKYK